MKTLIYTSVFLASTLAHAGVGEELKRLHKCYALFVRERIQNTDPLWLEVSNGSKNGTQACLEIFDKAKLNTNGEIAKGQDGQYDYEGMRVLNTFLRFHKSQLEVPNFGVGVGNTEAYTPDVIDSNEMVYHFVYSLFAPDQKYSDIVTRDFSLRGKRYSAKSQRARSVLRGAPTIKTFYQGVFTTVIQNDTTASVPNESKGGASVFNPVLAETGMLIGLERDTVENNIALDHFNPNYSGFKFTSTNVNQHMGGGLIGTQAYLLGNLGKDGFPTGGTQLFRRWSKHVMNDLLCRGLPALRSKDVIGEVIPESTIAFKTGISCMQCHSSMDPLAGAARNIRAVYSHNFAISFPRVKFIAYRNPDMPFAEMPTIAADNNFYRRPANGRLMYRSYDGELVKHEVIGIPELGTALAETNDLYVCAAKRYYQFLTGIDVNLADIGDINTPVFTKGQTFQRERVINLGLQLKQHQSLREMIKKIIESEAFLYPDRGV